MSSEHRDSHGAAITHAAGWKLNSGHDEFCDQAVGRWDGGCQCEFLARVRFDERQRIIGVMERNADGDAMKVIDAVLDMT